MTIDEAIKHCLEVAENNEQFASGKWIGSEGEANRQECEQCAAEHRQLAEWLTDYKELKNSVGAVKLELLKEAQAELEKRGNMLRDAIAELEEAKRLLKAAVEDFVRIDEVKLLPENTIRPMSEYTRIIDIIRHKWRYSDEAEKLLNDEK